MNTTNLSPITYLEIYQILNLLGLDYINKIPKKLYKYIADNKSNEDVKMDSISKEAITFIAMLHYKYWTDSQEEKNELFEIFNENEKTYKENLKKEVFGDSNNKKMGDVFKQENSDKQCLNTNENETFISTDNTELSLIKKEKFYIRIINFLKKLFFKNND